MGVTLPALVLRLLSVHTSNVLEAVVLANLAISAREAAALFGLFWAQFVLAAVVPASLHGTERVMVGVLYLILAPAFALRARRRIPALLRDGFRSPYDKLHAGLD